MRPESLKALGADGKLVPLVIGSAEPTSTGERSARSGGAGPGNTA